ncbi:MAG TPA: bifunctional diaminohydroxyphosphoribosylaminopyrimidine deaminase/5-amino-6-(5-phosphoribosylamino)uracil reductase RibD [Bacillota bacterium]|nr:bifunctional diaminohydroxyphosphoribosylaminopyrimidine deaminase/5-amino-6-(5-phosphoribosylamino)uracil reductase RibD [Bacillota bacterium]
MTTDSLYMQRALQLAANGRGTTYPNPMVGAVIVQNGRVIGEGWHRGPGQSHAEVDALHNCTESPEGATLYVTLEPCNHFGRTPPCTEAILKAEIGTVHYAVADPNPVVAGKGATRLESAGVQVTEGLLKAEAFELNRMFFHFWLKRKPWVILKAGMSLDAKLTSPKGESQWITGEASRTQVHQLRAEVGAVLAGCGTVAVDNPRLTCRMDRPVQRQPFKVVLDNRLAIDPDCNLLKEEPEKVIVFCAPDAPPGKEERLVNLGTKVIRYPQEHEKKQALPYLLSILSELGVQSVLVEGGSRVFTSFIEADLVDEYVLYYAPFFIGGTTSLPVYVGAGIDSLVTARRLKIKSLGGSGEDFYIRAYKEELEQCLPV